MGVDEVREGVELSNLDQPLFDDAEVTKRQLVDYLDVMAERILPGLEGRALSLIRARPGQAPFMQKQAPKGTPDWVRTVTMWAEASKRDVSYVVCGDRRTLLWLGGQRAVELHPALVSADRDDDHRLTHLVLDLDPPLGDTFAAAAAAARLVRDALAEAGLSGALKTSGSKGLHVFVPVAEGTPFEDAAAATRAIAERAAALDPSVATTAFMKEDREGKVFVDATRVGGATVVAAYSPRVRPGAPVSFPIDFADLDDVHPTDFTIATAPELLGSSDPWASSMPEPQALPADLVGEGRSIPGGRVAAMHEGKKRARSRRPS